MRREAMQGIAEVVTPREVGYIGKDAMYEFHKHLAIDGRAYRAEPDDFYLFVSAERVKGIFASWLWQDSSQLILERMPASLFRGKVGGEVVSYTLDGRHVELKLAADFQLSFKQAEEELSLQPKFLYQKDIPEECLRLNAHCFSKKALRLSGAGEKEPLTKASLAALIQRFKLAGKTPSSNVMESRVATDGAWVLVLNTCGLRPNDIELIVDEHCIHFMGRSSDLDYPESHRIILNEREAIIYSSFHMQDMVDIQKVTFKQGSEGIGHLYIRMAAM
jgi:hypothetical protein